MIPSTVLVKLIARKVFCWLLRVRVRAGVVLVILLELVVV